MQRTDIAIVGMACRTAAGSTLDAFWRSLRNGRECVGEHAKVDERRSPAGHWVELVPPNDDDGRYFDPGFFGLSPREADAMEPQQRGFLETAWHALEDGGWSTDAWGPSVGVYGGANFTSYWSMDAQSHLPAALDPMIGADKDYLATRVAHHLGLQGPALTVQSACSTSLVAIHLACQALAAGECEAALAGGAALSRPRMSRYYYTPGAMLSPDGYCRAFDANAGGTVFTEGVGVVLLTTLREALASRRRIYGVIRGSAVNNDGGHKASYLSPAIAGQQQVVARALDAAGLSPADLSYIEAHGTGTVIGDAIELAALGRVFRGHGVAPGACQIGSVKTNIGHTASAAGVLGLIKTALALHHGELPATVNFAHPNPDLDPVSSPFRVSPELTAWPRGEQPRRAGVSSFGVGGTNAHVVLEEAPAQPRARAAGSPQLLAVSAQDPQALARRAKAVARLASRAGQGALADLAYTLGAGRKGLAYRTAVVARSGVEARARLAAFSEHGVSTARTQDLARTIGFMFPGQGAQHPAMGADLYASQPLVRQTIDEGLSRLAQLGGPDVSGVFRQGDAAGMSIEATGHAQPAIFLLEYALGRLLIHWGLRPAYAIGHSLGEYAAACLSGALSFEDGLRLVSARGRLMQQLPPGGMLSVAASADELRERLVADVEFAAINGPRQCVLTGPLAAIADMEQALMRDGVAHARLRTSHAFHSAMMEPMLEAFEAELAQVRFQVPAFPFVSGLTGEIVTPAELGRPDYWLDQVRQPVMFARGLQTLAGRGVNLLLEVGPGRQLSALARQSGLQRQGVDLIGMMPAHGEERDEDETSVLLEGAGRAWSLGAPLVWRNLQGDGRMVSADAYPFARQTFRIDPAHLSPTRRAVGGKAPVSDWFYAPSWRRTELSRQAKPAGEGPWLIFADADDHSAALKTMLEARGRRAVIVNRRLRRGREGLIADPQDQEAYVAALRKLTRPPSRIVHLWPLADHDDDRALIGRTPELARILAAHREVFGPQPVAIDIVCHGAFHVLGDERLRLDANALIAFARVAPQEHPNVACRVLDVPAPLDPAALVEGLSSHQGPSLARRGAHWWTETFEPVPPAGEEQASRLKEGGAYVIFGGLGLVGRILARRLAERWKARLIIVGRSILPDRAEWAARVSEPKTDPALRRRLETLLELEGLGAQVAYLAGDVTQGSDVAALREAAIQALGAVDGVVFAAGLVGSGCGVVDLDHTSYEANAAPKALGLSNVMTAFAGDDLDFGLVTSSISSVLGGLGHAPYAAANLSADALVLRRAAQSDRTWMTVNWDLWADEDLPATDGRSQEHLQALAIQPQEGQEAFEALLRGPHRDQTVISTHDLQARIDRWILRKDAGEALQPEARHQRPHMTTAFAPVQGEVEEALLAVWERVLGIQGIGRDDDFFDMGGHSLLAVQAAADIQLALPGTAAPNLYKHRTIRKLATYVRTGSRG